MTDACVVGVDIGTTSAKAVVVDSSWRVRGEAREEYRTYFVGGAGAEQDPDDWWGAACRCISAALSASGFPASSVAAVGVSSQAPSVVLLDHAGSPLRRALLWMDRRGERECRLRAPEGPRVTQLTGNRLDPYYAAPKLGWVVRRSDGSLAQRVSAIVMANGYVVHRLTGALCVDSGHAGLTLLNDLDAGGWSDELISLWGLLPSWLPEVRSPSDVVGTVTAEAASLTGLVAGTPVVAGLVDGAAASLESGVLAEGDVCEMTGQSTVVNAAVTYERARRSTGALSVMPYVVPGHHLLFGSMVATGGILRWFRDEFGGASAASDVDAFAALDALAAESPVGAGGLIMLPYFLGERSPIWDSDARGAIVGLSMSSTRADLVRAILEGTAYGLAHNLEEMASLGIKPSALRVVGGGAKGTTWNQIKADVTGLPVELPTHSMGAPVGSALVAAEGVGLIKDLLRVVRDRFSIGARYDPNPQHHAAYDPRYAIYRTLYPALRAIHENLGATRAEVSR